MNDPLVSIVIDNFNYGAFVGRAVETALAQTHPHVEVIVVDDGSTDDSRAVFAAYRDAVVVARKENGGQASAFNIGFALSRGEVVMFLDADDELYPEAAARVASSFGPGIAKVHFRLDAVGRDGEPLGWCNPPSDWPLGRGDVLPLLLASGRYVTPPTSGNAFRRDVLASIMPIPESEFRISADGYLVIAAPFHGEVAAIEEPLGAYRVHGDNSWAPREIDAARLRAFVEHDLAKHDVVRRSAKAHGLAASRDLALRDHAHLRARLGSLRLDPARHPVADDTPWRLARAWIVAAARAKDLDTRRRVLFSLWFVWLALLPRRAALAAATWFYVPARRPGVISRAIRPVQSVRRVAVQKRS